MSTPVSLRRFESLSWLRLNRVGACSPVRSRLNSVLLALFCVALLSGCGFQLRGKVSLPPEMARTYITGLPQFSEFRANLRRQLRANGVEVVEAADDSTANLRITRNRSGKRILSVNDKGKVQEFELFVSIAFEVKGQETVLLENQTINLQREFLFNEDDVLGKAQEEQLVFKDMRKNLVRLMIYRLQAIGKA